MLTIKFLLKFIQILNKEASPKALAGGMAFGAVLGLTPKGSLHNLALLVIVLMIKVNLSAVFLAAAVFTCFAYLLDPLFNQIGYALLTQTPALAPLWTALYNTPLVPWTKFNNTLTLGSLVFSLALFLPLFFLTAWAIGRYRDTFLVKVNQWKVVKVLKASKLYGLYESVAGD